MSRGGKGGAGLFARRGLWPLWGILAFAVLLLGGRGCAPAGQTGAASVATSTATLAVGGQVPGASTPGAGAGSGAAAGPGSARAGAPTRGPGGTPVTPTERRLARCDVDRLPPEARRTIQLVRAGGPFPYPRNDGVTFRNAERLLPAKSTGYYREYTVPTPGSGDRGARRVVTGGDPATAPPQWYYTGDHYASFCEITGLT